MFDPAYDSYDPSIRLNGGVPKHIALRPPHFAIDWQEVRDTITPRTRLIIVNTPHNPTGSILCEADLKQLEAIAQAHSIIVLSDEVYERIIFDNASHESVLKYPGLAQHSVAVFSFGKRIMPPAGKWVMQLRHHTLLRKSEKHTSLLRLV